MSALTSLVGLPDPVVLAILDEPPFCWLEPGGDAAGCDVEVLSTVLGRAGIRSLVVRQVTFAELVPGVVEGRWHVNTGMFITEERRRRVRFTRPIWAVADGLIVRAADAVRFGAYGDLAARPTARLGVVVGQVQGAAARRAGVPAERLIQFATQDDAVRALRRGDVDAVASTAIGNRALLARIGDRALVAVGLDPGDGPHTVPLGAYSLSYEQAPLADLLDEHLAGFIGSPEHRAIMSRHGFTDDACDLLPAGEDRPPGGDGEASISTRPARHDLPPEPQR